MSPVQPRVSRRRGPNPSTHRRRAAARPHGAIIGAAGEGRVSSAARKDYAEAIAVTALDASLAGKIHELAGDTAHIGAEFAAAVATASGKPIAYVSMPQPEYTKALRGFGLPEGFAIALADSDACAAKGALHDASHCLSCLVGRPTTPISETITVALRGA
jgi:NAD(P)H dehydrogenase (quinone)